MPDIFDGSQDSGEVDPQETSGNSSSSQLDLPPAQSTPAPVAPVGSAAPQVERKTPATKHRSPDEYSEVMRHERPAKHSWDAFAPKPLSIHFDAQATDERILLLLRKHPITQVPWILAALFLSVIPFFFSFLPLFDLLPGNYQLAAFIGWYLLLLGFILESFLTWFFNVYIVTDERIIDVDFLSLIYKNVSAAKIDNIEDVTANTAGALQSVFNYGTVLIQTAAERTQFEFELVPQPNKVARLVNELLLEEEREKLEGRVS